MLNYLNTIDSNWIVGVLLVVYCTTLVGAPIMILKISRKNTAKTPVVR